MKLAGFDQAVTAVHEFNRTIPANLLYYTLRELLDRNICLENSRYWGPVAANVLNLSQPRMGFEASQRLILEAISLTGDPDLGLAIGFRQNISSCGILVGGYLACQTLRQAFELGWKYHHLVGGMLDTELTQEENSDVTFCANTRFGYANTGRFLTQEAFAHSIVQADFLSPGAGAVKSVQFAFRGSLSSAQLKRFGCPVTFGTNQNKLVFDGKALDRKIPTADPFSLRSTQAVLDVLLSLEMKRETLLESIEQICHREIQRKPSIESVAREMGISERSLRRKLDDAGSSFRDILNDIRREVALQLLLETETPLEQIAERIGYSDLRSLRRSILTWTGKSPIALRMARDEGDTIADSCQMSCRAAS